MSIPSPEAPPIPSKIEPPCPGCPDPDNAGGVDMPCQGPSTIEDPGRGLTEVPVFIRSIGAPACADIIYCPRTRGSRTG